jgi:nucleoside-diphosphate-sugar epimerase
MDQVFIAGCGYIGERVARLAREAGANVTCMTRSAERGLHLTAEGFETFVCALDDATQIPALDVHDRIVFYFVPPPGGGISDQRARNFCTVLNNSSPPSKIVYISATSVYTAKDGSVVTEQSPATPTSAIGKRRLDAESIFRSYGNTHGVPVVILRVSGIYGPGRLPLTQIHQGQPLLRMEESGPSNRIHADDLAQICVIAAEKSGDGDIFNVSDGQPSSMTEYFNAVADALGAPRQPQVSLEEARKVMTPLMLSYASESRVVDSSRMFERLGITLRYPTLQDGLKASISPIICPI